MTLASMCFAPEAILLGSYVVTNGRTKTLDLFECALLCAPAFAILCM